MPIQIGLVLIVLAHYESDRTNLFKWIQFLIKFIISIYFEALVDLAFVEDGNRLKTVKIKLSKKN